MLTVDEQRLAKRKVFIGGSPNLVRLFEDHDGSYWTWKAEGVRDRILVHYDGHLDFFWMADRSPEELLQASSSEELDALLDDAADWSLDGGTDEDQINIGNFIYPAIKRGIVREFYWVVPDHFLDDPLERGVLRRDLLEIIQVRPKQAGNFHETEIGFELSVLGCPLIVCKHQDIPHFQEPVLLDIDVDYLTTASCRREPPYFEATPPHAWKYPFDFYRDLQKSGIKSDLITIAYSVNGGYTPYVYKYFGDELRNKLTDPNYEFVGEPDDKSAAGKYRIFQKQFAEGDDEKSAVIWKELCQGSSSYRNPFAFDAWRLEVRGKLRDAQQIYSRMIALDPEWYAPHLGLGRIFWYKRRWDAAEKQFRKAYHFSGKKAATAFWLGRVKYKLKDYAAAQHFWLEASGRDRKIAGAWLGLAQCSMRMGNTDQAVDYLYQFLQRSSDVLESRTLFFQAELRKRHYRQAVRELLECCKVGLKGIQAYFSQFRDTPGFLHRNKDVLTYAS